VDGRRIVSSGEKGMGLWDVATGKEVFRFTGHEGVVWSVRCGPGRRILSGGFDGTMRLWEAPP
jgi:WD40 repeat protein